MREPYLVKLTHATTCTHEHLQVSVCGTYLPEVLYACLYSAPEHLISSFLHRSGRPLITKISRRTQICQHDVPKILCCPRSCERQTRNTDCRSPLADLSRGTAQTPTQISSVDLPSIGRQFLRRRCRADLHRTTSGSKAKNCNFRLRLKAGYAVARHGRGRELMRFLITNSGAAYFYGSRHAAVSSCAPPRSRRLHCWSAIER
jgi:hypothetical protein